MSARGKRSVPRVLSGHLPPILPVVPRICWQCQQEWALPWDASYYCPCGAHNDPRTGAKAWERMHQDERDVRALSQHICCMLRGYWGIIEELHQMGVDG